MEQTQPTEERSFEFSYASGPGFRPHPPGPARAPPGSPGQASDWDHSHRQAMYGSTRARQHTNRRPNEPPSSIKAKKIAKQ